MFAMSVFTHKSFSVNLSSPSKLLHPTRPSRATGVSRSIAPRASTAPDSDVVPGDIIKYAKTLPGISQPFPEIFDPLNLLNNATSVQEVRRWRESEITHGRVAMLASLGWLVGESCY
ncbi:g10094 [Coccomyxa viridis]|uniref:G10094 protein n=1 Tax=Coccomyxa viridis TaxID=1274662 RepID=A0ABP1G4L8_9CHLO